jgi:hypothetical protein
MERRPSPEKALQSFAGFDEIFEKFENRSLDLMQVIDGAGQRGVKIIDDPSTWVSKKTADGKVHIGLQKIPPEIARKFAWGADTPEKEYVVKLAHEHGHVIQNYYDRDLLHVLDGGSEFSPRSAPYIDLYTRLGQELKGLYGLSDMAIYHEQNRTTGNLDVPTYERMAEAIGSYLLGVEYFLYRIGGANLSADKQEHVEAMIKDLVQIVDEWKREYPAPTET